MTQGNRYLVKIQKLDGHGKRRSEWFTFSNDLQRGLKQMAVAEGLDAALQFLQGALIVYPLGPYIAGQIPPMGLGRILVVQRKKQGPVNRPRAQFLMPERWHGTDAADIRDALRYVEHDYSFWTRAQIAADLAAWRAKYHLPNRFWHWPRAWVKRLSQWRVNRLWRHLHRRRSQPR